MKHIFQSISIVMSFLLLTNVFAYNTHDLEAAISRLDVKKVDFLLKQGVNPNTITTAHKGIIMPMISFAVITDIKNRSLDLTRTLVANGADINYGTEDSQVGGIYDALSYALYKKNLEMVRFLLRNGADVKIQPYLVRPATCKYKICLDIAKLLIGHGADINETAKYYMTPLMWAAGKGNKAMVKLLLEHGADVNLKNEKGKTALQMSRSPEIKRMLEAAQ